MLPDFFVIGAQKAGSTYLLQCLEEHPRIFMPRYEVAFFEDSLYDERRIAEFEKHFDRAQPGQVIGVKRPNLLGHSECPERLHRHMPRLKLVVILRHPIERTVSGYFHYMRTGFIPVAPAEVGLRRLLHGQYAQPPRAGEIIEFSLYYKHLSHYERYYPRDRIHVVLLDDVVADGQREMRKVYRFLDVRDDFQPVSVSDQPMAAIYSLPRLRLRNALDRYCRSYTPDGKYFHRRRGPLATPLHALNMALDRLVWARLFRARQPQLSHALRQELQQLFLPDVERLEEWLGRDLSGWKAG